MAAAHCTIGQFQNITYKGGINMTDKIRKTIYLAKDIVQAIKIVAVEQRKSETRIIEDILRKNLEGVKFKM